MTKLYRTSPSIRDVATALTAQWETRAQIHQRVRRWAPFTVTTALKQLVAAGTAERCQAPAPSPDRGTQAAASLYRRRKEA